MLTRVSILSLLTAATALVLPRSTDAYPRFVTSIPNGAAIAGVRALGHRNAAGGGVTNAFGDAFKAQGFQWTLALCRSDADNDGATNGEELGDPCCQWSPTSTRQLVRTGTQVAHPGVANAWTSQQLEAMACQEAANDPSPRTGATGGGAAGPTNATMSVPASRSQAAMPGALLPLNGSVANRSANVLPTTIDPVGLTETPPLLVPHSPAPSTTRATALPATAPVPTVSSAASSRFALQVAIVAVASAMLTAL